MHYLLFYDVVDDYVNRRAPLRGAHITLARQAVARGELVLGGAFAVDQTAPDRCFAGRRLQSRRSLGLMTLM